MLVVDILVSRGEHYGVRNVLLKVIWRSVSLGSSAVIAWLFHDVCVVLDSGKFSDTMDLDGERTR